MTSIETTVTFRNNKSEHLYKKEEREEKMKRIEVARKTDNDRSP